jgi:hypothetical protein
MKILLPLPLIKTPTLLALPVLLLLNACTVLDQINPSGGTTSGRKYPLPPSAVHSITSQVDASGQPTNQSRSILLPGKVYLHSSWFNLPDRELPATIALQNSGGQIVHSAQSTFSPVDGRWISYAWYTFRAQDLPGVWRFEISIDGEPTSSREFLVRRSHGIEEPIPGDR